VAAKQRSEEALHELGEAQVPASRWKKRRLNVPINQRFKMSNCLNYEPCSKGRSSRMFFTLSI